jgi:hypothetical protein
MLCQHNPDSPEWIRLQALVRAWEKDKHYSAINDTWAVLLEEMGTKPGDFFAAISEVPIKKAGAWGGELFRFGKQDRRQRRERIHVPLALLI